MRESPRLRRLRSDLRALEGLRAESTVVDFSVPMGAAGVLPESYLVRFTGRGLYRGREDQVLVRDEHEVAIRLGAGYPRMMPELSWRTPIFHPNISSGGVVCLGGYGTHWVPSLQLDSLCGMLWDMIRYQNYDIESPYNREAALWARAQTAYRFPLDPRPIRDRVASGAAAGIPKPPPAPLPSPSVPAEDVLFLEESAIVDAELVEPGDSGILYIE